VQISALSGFGAGKAKFESFHIDPTAAKLNALSLQAQPLLNRGISAQLDLASRANDALPG
jgi:hypothetical protein